MSSMTFQEYRHAFGIQLRVIGALMLRELVGMSGGALGMWRLLVRPTAMVLIMYLLMRASGLGPDGYPNLIFAITGYLTWLAFIRCFGGVSIGKSIRLLMIPHVTMLDVVIALMAVEFVMYTCVFIFISFLGTLFEHTPPPADPLGAMLAYWSAVLMGVGMGLVAVSVDRFTTLLDDWWRIVRRVGHALSGVFFLATDAPESVMRWLKWNPLFHSVEWLRQSWWEPYISPIASPAYIYTCLFFLFAFALALERATRKYER